MSVFPVGDFAPVPNRPGRTARDLIGNEHGFDSMFVTETVMEPGSAIPLHRHSVEEGWVVLEGELTFRLGDEDVTVAAGNVVRVPSEVAHAVVNDSGAAARALTAAPWERSRFYSDATTYLEGVARTD
jgi:quercetin dioxygenase-like cupin family protein